MTNELLYEIGITLVPGIGNIGGKKLIAYCGGAEAVFKEKKRNLEAVAGLNAKSIAAIISQKVLSRAEKEIKYLDKMNIKPLFYLDTDYPKRLQHCNDSPVMLYYKGATNLNACRVVGIVGTRNASDYGRAMTEKIVEQLTSDNVLIVSGLAYGIDAIAHRSAIKFNIPTVGVLGHGLQMIYPNGNRKLAQSMLQNGGLLTEYLYGTLPEKENFPQRNRIVAGMIDCLVVVESALKGGALITADIADSYDRDVFAFPGRAGDLFSEGCNHLIKNNKANLILDVADIRYVMRWDTDVKMPNKQMRLFREFNSDEQLVLNAFGPDEVVHIDKIITETNMSLPKLASVLLSLEFDGVLSALPGKRYRKN